MRTTMALLAALLALPACEMPLPAGSPHQAKPDLVHIDGAVIAVFKQRDGNWAASGGNEAETPERYVLYRRQRAIELRSGCRVDKQLSARSEPVLVVRVKCA